MPEIHPIEEWRPVKGYEGIYSVSSLGRVRRDLAKSGTFSGRIIRGGRSSRKLGDEDGYVRVRLHNSVTDQFLSVHRLVATAFIRGPINTLEEVNHKNGIKSDNRPENLEWVTAKENIRHAEDTGLRKTKGEFNGRAKLSEGDVREIRERRANGEYPAKLSRLFGVNVSQIKSIINRKQWRHI